MKKTEYQSLLKSIRSIHPSFKGTDDLLNFKYDEVKTNFLKHKSNEDITYEDLTEGLQYENEKDVYMKCDICGELIHYTTWEAFDKHYRKCQKIDFINWQSKQIRGEEINKAKYYAMSEEELEKAYRPIMDYCMKQNSSVSFLKTL